MEYIVAYFVALAVLIVSNGLILIAQWRLRRQSKSPINAYVASLTITETMFGIFFVVASVETRLAHNSRETETFLCIVTPYFQMLCLSSNVFCMLAIAFDLYRVVCTSTVGVGDGTLRAERRRRMTACSLVVVWVSAVVYSLRAVVNKLSVGNSATQPPQHDDSYYNATDSELVGQDWNITNNTNISSIGWVTTTDVVMMTTERLTAVRSCNLFIEYDRFHNFLPRILDLLILFIVPILAQLILYIAVAIRLWSSQVGDATVHRSLSVCLSVSLSLSLALYVCVNKRTPKVVGGSGSNFLVAITILSRPSPPLHEQGGSDVANFRPFLV